MLMKGCRQMLMNTFLQVREAVGEFAPSALSELDVGVLRRDLPGEGLGLRGVEQDTRLAQVRRCLHQVHVGDDTEVFSYRRRSRG